MQLLSKPQINIQKVAERRQEIEQGVILARKIDKLRQDYTDEEAKLFKFRDETTATVLADIETLTRKVHSLKNLCSDLEERRKKSLEPLDKEWSLIEEERQKLQLIRDENYKKAEKNTQDSEENGRVRKTLDRIEREFQERDAATRANLDTAIELKQKRERESAEFSRERATQEKDYAQRFSVMVKREARAQLELEAQKILKDKNQRKEYELTLRERAFNIRENAQNNRRKQ